MQRIRLIIFVLKLKELVKLTCLKVYTLGHFDKVYLLGKMAYKQTMTHIVRDAKI